MASASHKAFIKKAKSKKKHEQILETADDFQAAGVEHEEAAGKWRAGDATKSIRFFQRAIEIYSQGLQKFPQSLDLAYNKARVELEIATHPVLVKQLPVPVLEALRHALISHQYALNLDRENADTLFNTSQVLTSTAEEIAKTDDLADSEALQCLQEALEMQDRCLSIQELRYEENVQQQQDITQNHPPSTDFEEEEDGGVSLETGADTGVEDHEQWASIVEPVTQDTLIDTVLAQLGTLTTLCGILSASPESGPSEMLAWVEEYSSKLLNVKLLAYTKQNDSAEISKATTMRSMEIALVKANLVSNLLEAGYRLSKVDAGTYKRERDQVFTTPEMSLENNFDGLLANGRSLIAFSVAVIEAIINAASLGQTSEIDLEGLAKLCWSALNTGLGSLLTASRLRSNANDQSDLATTHLLRGDISLLQYRLSLPPVSYQPALSNAAQLLRNAEVFYRNASKLSPTNDSEEKSIATLRSTLSKAIAHAQQQNSSTVTLAMVNVAGDGAKWPSDEWQKRQIEDMIDEGLIDPSRISH